VDWRLVSAIDPDTVYRKGDIAALQARCYEVLDMVSYLTPYLSGNHRKSDIFGCRERRGSLASRCKPYKAVQIVAIMHGIPPALPRSVGKVTMSTKHHHFIAFDSAALPGSMPVLAKIRRAPRL
jgi:hypothetical protein